MSDSRHVRLVAVALAVLSAAACMPYDLKQVLDGPQGKALDISPTSTVIPVNGGVTFTGNGGIPPYVYSIVSGGGTLDPVSGAYIAPVVTGTAVIRVTDKTGRGANATVAIQAVVTTLAIGPGALSLAVGSNVTFSASGGTPPYTFILQTNVSGSPGVGSTSGLYVAGPTPGTDVVRLTDSAAGVVTATVTVAALTSAVDYTIPTTSFPPSGTVSSAVPGGYTFTVKNSGSIPGSQPVDWKVYLSANTVLDGGDILIDSGTIGALASLASVPVTIAGSFPAVTPGPWYLIAQVSAVDDTTQVNNTSGAGAFTLLPKNIDYSIAAVAHSTGTVAGSSMTGSLTLHNGGNADGGATVSWAVYASTDTVLDGADYLLAFGSQAGVPALSSTAPISFNGYWPSTPGTWYLLAVVTASDDIGPANNTGYSAAVTTTGPGPANVDYTVVSVLNAGGATAGDPVSGSFTLHNGGSDSGSLPVFWTAYLSSNATLELGTDQVIDSGSTTALANGATSASIGFAGTWPSAPGTWRLIVAASASDDLVPGNNVTASAAIPTAPQDINYTVLSVGSTGGTTAGGLLTGSLTIRNVGGHAGSQFVPWAVYLSTDPVLNIGTDQLIATGSIAAPGLAGNTSSSALPFAGTWPASNVVRTWYLIATVGAGDDVNTTNDVGLSGGTAVNPPSIDYSPSPATNTGGSSGGGPLTGTFTIHNNGTANGSASVTWTAYLSSDAALDITDQAIGTGTIGPLAGLATSGLIGFAGTWPVGTATWYLLVKVSAADDVSAANDASVPTAVPVTGVTPAYTITAVPVPVGSTTGQAVSGAFTIKNTGSAAGIAAVNWQAFASLDAVYNSGDILVASGSIGGLGIGASNSPGYAGTWPSTPGTWYIIVRASATDAPPVPDAPSPAVLVSIPPQPNYTVSFSAAIPWSGLVGTAMGSTGTCQITINNVSTTNPGLSNVNWSVFWSTDNILDGGDTLIQQGSIGPLGPLGSQTATFAGTWPGTPGKYYWFIARVSAPDDSNPLNDVVGAPHPVAVGDYRYVEGPEDNSGVGPSPTVTKTSTTGVTTLGANQSIVIEGLMDAYQGANSEYDTYKFTTIAGMSRLSMRAMWATGYDDIDLYLWDTGATDLNSIEVGINSEPGNGTFDVSAVTPRICYVSANFWLANNTSGSAGQKYVIFVKGLP